MTKTRILVAALLATLLFASGCREATTKKATSKKPSVETTSQPKPEKPKVPGYRTFEDPDGMFRMLYPDKWFANGASSLAVEISPLRSNTSLRSERDTSVASVEVRAGSVRKDEDCAELVRKTVKGMLASNPAGSAGPMQNLKMAGGEGAWIAVEMASRQGDILKIFTAIGGKGERRVIMLGYSPKDEWRKNLPIFIKMAESFEFTKKESPS